MDNFENLPDAVQWHEGMLLSPQHLQQNEIYWHTHLGHRLSCLTPHYWGVRRLKLKTTKPVGGIVSIAQLECVLPDGGVVQFPGNYESPNLETDAGEICKKPGDKAWIWLIVNERGEGAACARNDQRRFDSLMPVNTRDENTEDGEAPVARIQVRISLHATAVGDRRPATACSYPLLQIETDAQNHLHFSTYHPPLLQLGASAFHHGRSLQELCRKTVQDLWNKARELAGERGKDRPDEDAALMADDQRHLAIARGLASVLPTLEIAAASDSTHPDRMYEALALAVGQVAGIGSDPIPLRMSPYEHRDCMPQFQSVFQYIQSKLALVDARYDFLPFARLPERDGYAGFARRVPADGGDELLVEIKRGDGQSDKELEDWVKNAQIVAENMREDARTRRMRGAPRDLLGPEELKAHGLRKDASVLRITNMRLEVTGKGMQDVIQPGQSILIMTSGTGEPGPVSLALIRKRSGKNGARNSAGDHSDEHDKDEIHAL